MECIYPAMRGFWKLIKLLVDLRDFDEETWEEVESVVAIYEMPGLNWSDGT